MDRKPLQECKTEAERRANYPQLCHLADVLQRTENPAKVLQAAAWIIRERKREQEAAADGKSENE